MPTRRPAAAHAAALAVLLLAPAAGRAATVTYDVTFSGTASYEQEVSTEDNLHSRHDTATVDFSGSVDGVVFRDGYVQSSAPVRSTITGGSALRTYLDVDTEAYRRDCRGAPTLAGPGTLYPTHTFAAAPRTWISLTPFSGANFMLTCASSGGPAGGEALMLSGGMHDPRTRRAGSFLLTVEIPTKDVGRAAFPVGARGRFRDPWDCPARTPQTRSCTMAVRAALRFVRAETREEPPDHGDDDLLTPLVARPQVDRGARAARLKARCSLGCRFRIRAFADPPAARRRGRAAASALVAERSGTLPAGLRARTLTVALAPRMRAAVRRAGGVRLVVALDPPIGATVRRTLRARLAGGS